MNVTGRFSGTTHLKISEGSDNKESTDTLNLSSCCFNSSPSSKSKFIKKTFKSLEKFLSRLFNSGISLMHGGHQSAQ